MHRNKTYYVYILTNPSNTVLYVGVTNDLCRRLDEHNDKADSDSFTAKYKTNKLVYVEIFGDPFSAITREKQIKAGSRLKKVELVHSMNPNWEEMMVIQ